MKIVVIGGSGFIGRRLIVDLCSQNHSVLNIDLEINNQLPCKSIVGDVRRPATFSTHLEGADMVVLLAAAHRDDVQPISLYYEVNVEGMQNVLDAARTHGVKNIVFTSTVAVYGMNRSSPPHEKNEPAPFNEYGKSKVQAEALLRDWCNESRERNALILRPTVLFGEGNRGNVYNLLQMVHSGRFIMVGDGLNYKSMAYVGNFVAFISYFINHGFRAVEVFNAVDTPDLNMKSLVALVYEFKGKKPPRLYIPYFVGVLVGRCFDFFANSLGRRFSISAVRIEKFCASTQINANKMASCGFKRPFKLEESIVKTLQYEFGDGSKTQ